MRIFTANPPTSTHGGFLGRAVRISRKARIRPALSPASSMTGPNSPDTLHRLGMPLFEDFPAPGPVLGKVEGHDDVAGHGPLNWGDRSRGTGDPGPAHEGDRGHGNGGAALFGVVGLAQFGHGSMKCPSVRDIEVRRVAAPDHDGRPPGPRGDSVGEGPADRLFQDRKSTRLNSSHVAISYA